MTRDRFTPLAITFACILLIGAVALRWNGLDQPHWGIDEGVTFTIGQQIAEGDVLYRDAVDHRTPLVPYLKALVFLVAGDWNIFAVRLMVALMLGLGALFVWRLARQLGNEPAGVVGAGVFTRTTGFRRTTPGAVCVRPQGLELNCPCAWVTFDEGFAGQHTSGRGMDEWLVHAPLVTPNVAVGQGGLG